MKTLAVDPQQGGRHYGDGLQPWDLQRDMPSTGDVFLDGRRTDVLEYVFRIKHAPDESGLQGVRRDAVKAMHNLQAMIARIDELEPPPPPPDTCMAMEARPMSYQDRVWQWMVELWPPEVREDKLERCFRFFEESAELVQSLGMTYGQAIDLVTYVWQRPLGEPEQEVGGVFTTLYALCCAHDMDGKACANRELERVNRPEIKAKIRAKNLSKPKGIVSALPGIIDESRYELKPDDIVYVGSMPAKVLAAEIEAGNVEFEIIRGRPINPNGPHTNSSNTATCEKCNKLRYIGHYCADCYP